MSIDSTMIRIGPLSIHFYALILMTGILVGAWVAARRVRGAGRDPAYIWDGLIWAVIPGLIGARLYHVLTPSPASGLSLRYYLEHPEQILAIWNGGLGIYGAILGGLIGIALYARRKKEPLAPWLDLVIPGVAVAQAIGRWGNFVNQELYGAPTTLPWAVYIPPGKRLPGFESFETFHPLFLYESLLSLLAFGALLFIERRFRGRLKPGDLILIYLMLYALIRFMLDFLRLDSNGFGAITTAQIIGLIIFFGAGVALVIRHRHGTQPITPKSKTENAV